MIVKCSEINLCLMFTIENFNSQSLIDSQLCRLFLRAYE
jgi:hypothetical protein